MKVRVFLLIYLIYICSCDPIVRPFIHSGSVPNEVETILTYFGDDNDKMKMIKQSVEKTEEGISKAFKKIRGDGYDTVFGYLPDMNFTMVNEYAVKYGIYLWNAILFPEEACFTNIIFGYDFPLTSLKSIFILYFIFFI